MTLPTAPSAAGGPVVSRIDSGIPAYRHAGRRQTTRSLTVPGEGPNRPQVSRSIPVADVPVYPVVSGSLTRPTGVRPYPTVLDAGSGIDVSMARYAIALALSDLGLRAGDRVLIPAYHCDSMIVPLEALSAQPVFYRIEDDLSVDLKDLEAKIDTRTRVVMAVHYFGFHQKIEAIREICDRRGIVLLEDCAHAFFGEISGRPIGSYGDYAVASYWKFFPIAEGGLLTSATRPLEGLATRAQGAFANLSALRHLLEQASYYGRLRPLRPLLAAVHLAGGALKHRFDAGGEGPDGPVETAQSGLSSNFNAGERGNAMLGLSRGIVRLAARRCADIAERRRHNYSFLLGRLSKIPGCRPVMPELREGVVPFMFPLCIDRLSEVFVHLENAAVPMQRFGQFLWPGIDETTCPVSANFSHRMIQLPCHQELKPAEMEWMVSAIRNLLTR